MLSYHLFVGYKHLQAGEGCITHQGGGAKRLKYEKCSREAKIMLVEHILTIRFKGKNIIHVLYLIFSRSILIAK